MAGKGGGGAWKVAYADFVTAMMAFFLVMWITAQSKPVKTAVAEYFRDPYGSQKTPSTSPVASRGPDVPASIHSAATHPVGWGFLPGDTPSSATRRPWGAWWNSTTPGPTSAGRSGQSSWPLPPTWPASRT
jgi:hypothetical protein